MSLMNTSVSYSGITKLFHWVIAVLVIVMLIFGFFLSDIPETYQGVAYDTHKLIGLLILSLMVLRVMWALVNVRPSLPLDLPRWQVSAAHVVHLLLYVTVIAMPLCGWVGSVAAGYPPQLGGWTFNLPVVESKPLVGLMFEWHGMLAYTIISLLVLHVGAALYHHFVRRDGVLKRMLPW